MLKIDFKSTGILTKKNLLRCLGAIILIITVVVLTAHDDSLYQTAIVKLTSVTTTYEKTASGPHNEAEKYYSQTLNAVVRNGEYKGQKLTLQNEFAQSTIKTEQYSEGESLFVEITNHDGVLQATITGVKRDTDLVLLVAVTFSSLLLVTSRRGLLTIVSLVANTAIFILWITLNGKSVYDPENWILLIIGFCTVTLFLVSGFHRKTAAALLSSLCCIGLVYGLYQLISVYTAKLPFELVEYMTGPDSAEPVFIISVIVGSLGAIMDVAITICSSVGELTDAAADLSLRELIASIREIAMDIMGTMINVLFFSYISSALFRIVLELKNGYSVFSLLHFSFVFEAVRFLTGSIGIVLTIPLSALIAVVFFRKRIAKAGEI